MKFEPYDENGHGDPRGFWGLRCWNAMSPENQELLVGTGIFRGYGGGTCDKPSEVAVETDQDLQGGPRFYCRPCAIVYLSTKYMSGA